MCIDSLNLSAFDIDDMNFRLKKIAAHLRQYL